MSGRSRWGCASIPSLCYGMAKNYGCADVNTVTEVLLDKVFVINEAMKIKEVREIIRGAGYIRNSPLGIMWFRGESTELNGVEISKKELFLRAGFSVSAPCVPSHS